LGGFFVSLDFSRIIFDETVKSKENVMLNWVQHLTKLVLNLFQHQGPRDPETSSG
jgi:hypothetical protein